MKDNIYDAAPIASQLYGTLRHLFFREIKYYATVPSNQLGIHNFFAPTTIIAFPMSICVWEAIINEVFLSVSSQWHFRDNPLLNIKDKIERWDLSYKTKKLPLIYFNKKFDTGTTIYADFKLVLEIRNAVVHYKYTSQNAPQNALDQLIKKRIIKSEIKRAWYTDIFSTECMRFCINTISEMSEELNKCIDNRDIFDPAAFQKISDEQISDFLDNKPVYGIDFTFKNP